MKNYRINFIGNKYVDITAEQAANIYNGLEQNTPRILINGEVFMSHQITSIERIKGQELKDLCSLNKINCGDAPRIENYLSNKKLLK